MANYEKPVIIDTEEHYEGVYAASGDNTDSGVSVTTAADSSLKNTGEATMLITATAIRTGSVSDTSLMMRLTGAMSVCANT